MANVTINGNENFTGVEEVCLKITNGGGSEQRFVLPPSGSQTLTENDTYDVSALSQVTVNVQGGGSDVTIDDTLSVEGAAADAKAAGDAIGAVEAGLDSLNGEKTGYELATYTVEANKIYATNFTGGTTLSNYSSYIVDVEEGEKYLVTTTVVNNTHYCVAMFYDSDMHYLGYSGKNPESSWWSVTDYEVTVPANAAKMITSVYKNYLAPVFKREVVAYVDLQRIESDVDSMSRDRGLYYDGTNYYYFVRSGNRYLARRFKHCNANHLFQWQAIYYGDLVGNAFSPSSEFAHFSTDIIGPIRLCNEDLGFTGVEWTGGNHDKTINGAHYPTAEEIDFAVYANNTEVTEEGIYFGDAHIIAKNNLYFPQSVDGTGFENYTLAVVETREYYLTDTLKVRVWLDFKESARISMYYGMQYLCSGMDTLMFANNGVYGLQSELSSPNGKERKILMRKNNLHVDMHLFDVGLGSYTHNNGQGNPKYCSIWEGKVYYCLITGDHLVDITDGTTLVWEGEYALYED